MPNYTQTELLAGDFISVNSGILGGLLNVGLYIFGATSKVGKTMIATSLVNAVANGTDYLGKSNVQGKVLYFDNDNYPHEAKKRVNALGFQENENIIYYFGEEASSLKDIKDEIKYLDNEIKKVKLVIVDCYINLSEFSNREQKFENIYPKLKDFRDFIVEKELACIIIHHTKKSDAQGQDKLLGPRAMSAATTGSILLNVENEFSKTGQLEFILREKKEIISIKKDENDISWNISDDEDYDIVEEIPRNILLIINRLVKEKDHRIKGSGLDIVNDTQLDVSPAGLIKHLKKHKKILDQNGVSFRQERTSTKRFIVIELNDYE